MNARNYIYVVFLLGLLQVCCNENVPKPVKNSTAKKAKKMPIFKSNVDSVLYLQFSTNGAPDNCPWYYCDTIHDLVFQGVFNEEFVNVYKQWALTDTSIFGEQRLDSLNQGLIYVLSGEEIEQPDCAPIFRDVLLYYENGKITGKAFMCFECGLNVIQSKHFKYNLKEYVEDIDQVYIKWFLNKKGYRKND